MPKPSKPARRPPEPSSSKSDSVSKLQDLELNELRLLEGEYRSLMSELEALQGKLSAAPPSVVEAEKDPLNSVLEAATSLIPVVGPLLALL